MGPNHIRQQPVLAKNGVRRDAKAEYKAGRSAITLPNFEAKLQPFQRTDKLREACTQLVRRDTCEQILWHYTSADAAIEIVKSSCLHLACHSFMSDPAEGLRSPALVTASWQAAIDRVGKHPKLDLKYLRDTDIVLAGFGDYKPHNPPTFLVSFSVLRDSLSQWARYGADGAGIALGFRVEPAHFKRFTPAQERSYGPFLYKIFYDLDDDQRADKVAVSPAVDTAQLRNRLTDLFDSFLRSADAPTEIENALYLIAHDLKPVIKQSAYYEEQEWRIAAGTVIESTSLYDLRATRFGIAPFMVLPFGSGVQLEEIRFGPKLSRDNQWTCEWLCRKHGLSVNVSQSAFAYR